MFTREKSIFWMIGGLIVAGTFLAIPAALLSGVFGDGPPRAFRRLLAGPNLGVLSARPDMSIDDLVKQSTIKLDVRYARSAIAGGGVFDFVIPGTSMRFAGARYYYINTYGNDPVHIRSLSIGTSPEKMPLAAIDSADAALRTRLAHDGWLAGHEVYLTELGRQLHGGASEGPEGHQWLKDEMLLSINRNRMDEAKPGEDPATAGEWIQYVDLWARKEYPGIERYLFQPPRPLP